MDILDRRSFLGILAVAAATPRALLKVIEVPRGERFAAFKDYAAPITSAGLAGPDGVEISGSGYKRQPLSFHPAEDGAISSARAIDFPANFKAPLMLTYLTIYDVPSGRRIMQCPLNQAVSLSHNETLRIPAGSLNIDFDGPERIESWVMDEFLEEFMGWDAS